MSDILPNGITFNDTKEKVLEVELPIEIIEQWNCSICELKLEAAIIGENGRYEGIVRVISLQSVTWQGKLPKDRNKAEKYLKDNLSQRINKHKGMH